MPDEHLPAPIEPTPLVLIQQALEAKYNPADLKDLFELQRMHAADQAERAYADAITAFQAECPPIRKNAMNPHSKKTYADYEGIMRAITPLLRKHRIVITFDTAEDGARLLTTCRVRVGTVEKVTTVALPLDAASKQMNAQQAGGAAITYGRRYALTAALNLVVTDEDTDGLPDTYEAISEGELKGLRGLLLESNTDTGRFLEWAGKTAGLPVASVADLPRSLLAKAETMLRQKRDRQKQAQAAEKAKGVTA